MIGNTILNTKEFIKDPLFSVVGRAADALSVRAYVIGGFVRDQFLGRPRPSDLDFVVVGDGPELAAQVSNLLPDQPEVHVFKNFGTAMINWGDVQLEFVGARVESYRDASRKPEVQAGTMQDDQNRRDFTINALAICVNSDAFGELLDPFHGLEDLHNSILRTPLEPHQTFSDDPLRMMRAARFANQLGFEIEAASWQAICDQAERLSIVSRERIMDEFHKIMATDKPSKGLSILFKTGLLNVFFPELVALHGVDEVEGQTHKDNFYHTLQVVDNTAAKTENLWLRWAALLHDIGKPRCKRFDAKIGWTFHGHEFVGSKMIPGIFRRLKMPMNEKMKYVQKLVKLSARPVVLSQEEVTDSAIRRLLFDAGNDIDDLMILCESDITTKNPRRMKRYLNNYQIVRKKLVEIEEKDFVKNLQPPVDGQEIMRIFNLPPGREIGIIKNRIKEAILDGHIKNNREEALALMHQIGAELGLSAVKNSSL